MQAVAHTFPESFTPEKQRELHHEIVRLYDLTDDALAVVERENAIDRNAQMKLLTPVVTQVINSTNILSAFYTQAVNKRVPVTPELQDTMESALRNVFMTIKLFIDAAEKDLQQQPHAEKSESAAGVSAAEALAAATIAKAKGGGSQDRVREMTDAAIARARESSDLQTENSPLYLKFQKSVRPGATQNRAAELQERLPANGGADLIAVLVKIGNQSAQLARELKEIGIISSFDKAVPAFSMVSRRARQLSGIEDTQIQPGMLTNVQRLT